MQDVICVKADYMWFFFWLDSRRVCFFLASGQGSSWIKRPQKQVIIENIYWKLHKILEILNKNVHKKIIAKLEYQSEVWYCYWELALLHLVLQLAPSFRKVCGWWICAFPPWARRQFLARGPLCFSIQGGGVICEWKQILNVTLAGIHDLSI